MGEIGVNSTGAYVVLGENSKTAYRGDRGKAATIISQAQVLVIPTLIKMLRQLLHQHLLG